MNRVLLAALLAGCCSCAPRADGESVDDVALAGTVYWTPAMDRPVDRAFVRVSDANKSQRCFVTACDGSFVVRRGDVPTLAFPLLVSVERVDDPEAAADRHSTVVLRRMSSRIGRDAQCGSCHQAGGPTSTSAGPISLLDDERSAASLIRPPAASCASGAPAVEIRCPEDRLGPAPSRTQAAGDVIAQGGVHELLARRCGSLDCHGSSARQLRVWSRTGMRLGGRLVGREPTSEEEIQATFDSVASLDPGLVLDKARGRADHGGGTLVFVGDPGEQCLAGWLGVARDRSGPQPTSEPSLADACRSAASAIP